jgi:hypothetical protein
LSGIGASTIQSIKEVDVPTGHSLLPTFLLDAFVTPAQRALTPFVAGKSKKLPMFTRVVTMYWVHRNGGVGVFEVPSIATNRYLRAMPVETFKASRWTTGNLFFPTIIEVSEKSVVRRKKRFFGMDEISMSISKVASVHINTGFIWSEILIESSGGSDPLRSHGHTKEDARRIRDLIESHQAQFVDRKTE